MKEHIEKLKGSGLLISFYSMSGICINLRNCYKNANRDYSSSIIYKMMEELRSYLLNLLIERNEADIIDFIREIQFLDEENLSHTVSNLSKFIHEFDSAYDKEDTANNPVYKKLQFLYTVFSKELERRK